MKIDEVDTNIQEELAKDIKNRLSTINPDLFPSRIRTILIDLNKYFKGIK